MRPSRLSVSFVEVAALALIAFAPSLGAQNTTAPISLGASRTGRAQIVGVVVDSVNGIAPAEYNRGGVSCITIILWTRYKIRG